MKLEQTQKLFIREAYKKIIQDFRPYYDFSNCTDYQLSCLFGLYQPYLVKKIRAYYDFLSPTRVETKDIYKSIKQLMRQHNFDQLVSEKTFYILFSESMVTTLSKMPYSKSKFYYIWAFIIRFVEYKSIQVGEDISSGFMRDIVSDYFKRING